jgi:hypothetical protein
MTEYHYRLWQTEEFEELLENEKAKSRYQIDDRLDKIRYENHFGTRRNVSDDEKEDLKKSGLGT